MLRRIIEINEELCNGCGLCADACHEGAIGMVDGKAKLLRDDYCDGLGDCLPVCPTGAIQFVEREAAEYDEAAVQENMAARGKVPAGGCPGSAARAISREEPAEGARAAEFPSAKSVPGFGGCPGKAARAINRESAPAAESAGAGVPAAKPQSRLGQWPVQIKLVPVNAPYFNGARLLIAADCTAFAYAGFHEDFIKGHITIIGCPKLDEGDYADKLTAILQHNNIKSVTVARMEVPCCGGLSNAAIRALQNCGKMIPWQVVTVSTDGRLLDEM